MIVLLTDFGLHDPYQAQLKAVIQRAIPDVPVVDLFSNLPDFNVEAAAYLIPAYINEFPLGSVFICVVDPGVGSARLPVMLKLDGNWFVGPDNGIFEILWRRASKREIYKIEWRPKNVSNSFHGRDIFAPVACALHQHNIPENSLLSHPDAKANHWPDELSKVIYIDHFGNSITGIRANKVSDSAILVIGQQEIGFAKTFSAVKVGQLFWYCNANGLLEISANQDNASKILGIQCGSKFTINEVGNSQA